MNTASLACGRLRREHCLAGSKSSSCREHLQIVILQCMACKIIQLWKCRAAYALCAPSGCGPTRSPPCFLRIASKLEERAWVLSDE